MTSVIVTDDEGLRTADQRYRLDDLPLIRRDYPCTTSSWTAICRRFSLYAHKKGEDAVINLAKAWMERLSLPSQFSHNSLFLLLIPDHSVLAISGVIKAEPNSSQTSEHEASNFRKKVSVKNSFFLSSFFSKLRLLDSLLSANNTLRIS